VSVFGSLLLVPWIKDFCPWPLALGFLAISWGAVLLNQNRAPFFIFRLILGPARVYQHGKNWLNMVKLLHAEFNFLYIFSDFRLNRGQFFKCPDLAHEAKQVSLVRPIDLSEMQA